MNNIKIILSAMGKRFQDFRLAQKLGAQMDIEIQRQRVSGSEVWRQDRPQERREDEKK